MLFERKLAGGLAVSCEGGPVGSLMVPLAWTDRGVPAADAPLTYEVLIDLAEVVSAVKSRHGRVSCHNSYHGSELVFSAPVRLLFGTR